MKTSQVREEYQRQLNALNKFRGFLENNELSSVDLRAVAVFLVSEHSRLLETLILQLDGIQHVDVDFFKLVPIDLDSPPFEKDFFKTD